MNMWFQKKNNDTSKNAINSGEYEQLHKRITELNTKIETYKTDVDLLKTDVANLRGKFNQRLKGLEKEEKVEPKEEKEETETINNNQFVAFG